MLIDWFTVGAQVLNFLILVWLMKRFLYQPILHAIDEREKRIAADLADADQKRADAAKEETTFKEKNATFDEERADLLTQAAKDAQAERKRLLEETREAADALGAKRAEALRAETHQLHRALRRKAQDEVFAISRRALGDLASVDLEERLVDVFIRRLRDLDDKARTTLAAALAASTGPATVRTAFELPAGLRGAVQEAVNIAFSAEVSLRFETAPDRVSGIEFAANGQKLAWSIADYLSSMEKAVGALLDTNDKPDPEPASPSVALSDPALAPS